MKAAGIFLAAVLAGSAMAQTAAVLSPPTLSPLFGVNGQPLSAGLLYTCVAGSSCPGTPQASYTDSGAGTMNANPVVLNAAGMAPVWLLNLPYKLVLKTSAGVTVATVDNWLPGGFSTTGPWSTSGTTIYNATSGTKVCIGATPCTTALAELNVQGTSSGTAYLIRIDDAGNSPGLNLFGSGNAMGSYAADSAGLRLRAADGSSQMTVAAGNVTLQDARSSGATVFTLKAGAAQGSANLLQAQNNAGTNLGYIDSAGRFVSPLFNGVGAGTLAATDYTFKNANDKFLVNTMGDVTSSGGINATGANGNDPYKVNGVTMVDAGGNATFTTLTCTDTPCGSGGGGGGSPGGITLSIQTKASASTFGGSADLTYNSATGIVQLLGSGYMTSHGGYLSDGTAINVIQAPNGGVTAKWLYASDSWFLAEEAAPAVSASGQSRIYMDSTAHRLKASQHGGAYFGVATSDGALTNGNCVSIDGSGNFVDAGGPCTTGGGGGTVSSSTANNVTYYTATGTTVGGSSSFTWNNGTKQAAITSTSTAVAALTVTSGYIAADGGFSTTSSATNAIQAPNGGVASKWLYTSDSLILAEEAAPALSGAGQARIYADSSSHDLRVSQNGSAYAVLGAGGGGVTSITGTANQVIRNVATGAVILSLPQDIATNSNVNFATVTTTGVMQSSATGASLTFKNSNNNFSVSGAGNLSAVGEINLALAGGVTAGPANLFKIGGTTVIDNNRNATVVNLTITGTCTGCASSGVSSAAGTSNQVLVNGGTGAQSGAITLSLPQSIGTSSTPTFGGVVASGAFNSAATGSSRAFQTSGTTFIVNGDGNVSTVADVNLNSTGGTGTLKVAGNIVINSSGQFVGANGISTSGGGTFGSGVTFNGGLTTNFSTNSILYIGTGSLYLRTFSGGDASCGGVTNGWVGIRTDTDEIQVCIGGAVKKASLF